MERRSHRIAILALVVVLHVPLLLAVGDRLAPRAGAPGSPGLRVEFVLNEERAVPPPMPQRRALSRPRRVRAATLPREHPVDATHTAGPSASFDPGAHAAEAIAPESSLLTADGALRISSTLADDIAQKPTEGPNTFHIPRGDAWVLREPRPPIQFQATRFADAFLPEGMNPVEEACWRNRGFAFLMTMLGSRDCADPGGKDPRPMPAMIVYGVDRGEDILRKTEEWRRYRQR